MFIEMRKVNFPSFASIPQSGRGHNNSRRSGLCWRSCRILRNVKRQVSQVASCAPCFGCSVSPSEGCSSNNLAFSFFFLLVYDKRRLWKSHQRDQRRETDNSSHYTDSLPPTHGRINSPIWQTILQWRLQDTSWLRASITKLTEVASSPAVSSRFTCFLNGILMKWA